MQGIKDFATGAGNEIAKIIVTTEMLDPNIRNATQEITGLTKEELDGGIKKAFSPKNAGQAAGAFTTKLVAATAPGVGEAAAAPEIVEVTNTSGSVLAGHGAWD